ncbi:MAG TPA: hypothetical protein VI076_10620 [Actinopolymorphaceae bacterium]
MYGADVTVRDQLGGRVRRSGRLAVATGGAVVTALLLLVGCTDPSPTPSPLDDNGGGGSRTAETTPSKEPSPTPPDEKALGKDVTDAALRWIAASNQAMKTLDPAPVLALSADSCENCRRFADHLRKTKRDKGRNEGAYDQVPQGVSAPKITGHTAKVTVTVKRGAWRYLGRPGAKPQSYPAETYDIEFDLTREGDRWIVTEEAAYTEG